MRRIAAVALLIAAALLAGCYGPAGFFPGVRGSGQLDTREYSLSGFTRVEAGSTFVLDVAQGESTSVTVTADDNLFAYLDVTRIGDTLRLRLRSGHSYRDLTLQARITMPALRGLELSGAARASVTGFRSDRDLEIELSGASNLKGDLQAADVRIDASGASSATLRGSARNLSVDGSGASAIDLADVPVADASVHLSGASRATLDLTGRLDAELSGGSRLEYAGSPRLGRIRTSGGSSLHRR